jgi:multidrug efflux pump subunit AcrA (membrane-fusion protein)
MKKWLFILLTIHLVACKSKVEKIKPTEESISESIYASGLIKSKNQYQAFATVNGIIDMVFVSEGDTVKKGTPLLNISNEAQRLNKENAELSAQYLDVSANQGKLNEAKQFIALAKNKMKNDSALFYRQTALWKQQVGTKVALEQSELAYQNSRNAYYSSMVRYNDLKRQINLNASQSKKNLQISSKMEGDYTLRSEIDGVVYSLAKSKGEMVGIQTPLATIGDAKNFILEMQVDEYDILKIKKGLSVFVTMDSYKGQVFEAIVTKINPLMNERSKTFLVEGEFIKKPETLYPNISFEGNIVIRTKEKAILIPRNYLVDDSTVLNAKGDKVKVKVGLKDYKKVEILSGLSINDEIIKPTE